MNVADNFVPGNGGRHDVLLPVQKNPFVGSANRTAPNAQNNLSRPRLGLAEHPRFVRLERHGKLLPSYRFLPFPLTLSTVLEQSYINTFRN